MRKDHEYDGKNSTFLTVPFGEFLKAMKKVKVPVTFTESGTSAVLFKSGKIKYELKLLDEDADVYTNHDTIMKKFTKANTTLVTVTSGDMMALVDQLDFASGMSLKIKDKKLYFESLSGNLTGGYEIDIDVPDTFEWESAFSMVYMKLLSNLAVYTKEIKLHVESPADPEDDSLPMVIELDVGTNSSVKIVMGSLDASADAPGVGVDIDDDDGDAEEFDFDEDIADAFEDEEE